MKQSLQFPVSERKIIPICYYRNKDELENIVYVHLTRKHLFFQDSHQTVFVFWLHYVMFSLEIP